MVIFKPLKSSYVCMLLLYFYCFHLMSSCFHSPQKLQSVRVCLSANLNLNTLRQTQHQMKSPAKSPLTSLGVRPTGEARLPWEACISHSHPAESVRTRMRYYLKALLLVFHATHHFSFVLQNCMRRFLLSASNKLKRLDESLETVLGQLGLQTASVMEGSPNSPLPAAQPSQNNVAVLNIAPLCSFNKQWFLQRVQVTTFVKISTST